MDLVMTKNYKDILSESIDDRKIYKVKQNGEIWIAYGAGSGSTVSSKKSFISDRVDEESYDYNVKRFLTFAEKNKPLKQSKSKTVKMFELPVYDSYEQSSFDIWGGDVKPSKKEYFVVSKGIVNVVNFFKTKNEAVKWINHSV